MSKFPVTGFPGYYYIVRPSIEHTDHRRLCIYLEAPAPQPDIWISNRATTYVDPFKLNAQAQAALEEGNYHNINQQKIIKR